MKYKLKTEFEVIQITKEHFTNYKEIENFIDNDNYKVFVYNYSYIRIFSYIRNFCIDMTEGSYLFKHSDGEISYTSKENFEKLYEPIDKSYWMCYIGPIDREKLPQGADFPLRQAVKEAYINLTNDNKFICSSGWGNSEQDIKLIDEILFIKQNPENCKKLLDFLKTL